MISDVPSFSCCCPRTARPRTSGRSPTPSAPSKPCTSRHIRTNAERPSPPVTSHARHIRFGFRCESSSSAHNAVTTPDGNALTLPVAAHPLHDSTSIYTLIVQVSNSTSPRSSNSKACCCRQKINHSSIARQQPYRTRISEWGPLFKHNQPRTRQAPK